MQFVYNSEKLNGRIFFSFFADGRLKGFDLQVEDIDEKLRLWFLKNLPTDVADMKRRYNKGQLVQLNTNVTFDEFWEAYDYKVDKAEAIKQWEKLSQQSRDMAYAKIPEYRTSCTRRGIALIYPSRFLKKEYFLTDWRKI